MSASVSFAQAGNRRDSFVCTPTFQEQYSREHSPKSRRALARASSRSGVGASGCRECENPVVVLVLFLGGLANVGQALLSVRDMPAVAEPMCLRVGDQRLVKYPSDLRHWYERRVLSTLDAWKTAETARSAMVAVWNLGWDTYLMSESELPPSSLALFPNR